MLQSVPLTKKILRWRVPALGQVGTPTPAFVVIGGAYPSTLGGYVLPNGERVKPGEYIVEVYCELHRSQDGSYRQFI